MTFLGMRLAAASICIFALGACGTESSDGVPSDGGGNATPGDTSPSTAPARRGGAPAAWMPTAGAMVIFGGMDPITNDTWAYDLDARTWSGISSD